MFGLSFGEIASFFFLAVALGMDAFSVSLAIGMQELRKKRIFHIGLVIGLFHTAMPFIGLLLGQYLSGKVGDLANLFSGLLLVLIGIQMVFSAFAKKKFSVMKPTGLGLVLFALTVSADSFSVGISLGIQSVYFYVTIFMFGTVSMMLTWIGLLIGRNVHHIFGVYSEFFGGTVLTTFGLYLLFA